MTHRNGANSAPTSTPAQSQTPQQQCLAEYQAAQTHRAESAGAQRDQLGSATGAGLHTNRG